MGSNVRIAQRFRAGRIRSTIAKAGRFYCSRRGSDFRAASLVGEGHSLRSPARHPLDNDAAGRHAYDLRPAKSFAACDVEGIIRIAASPSAPVISVISIISVRVAITIVNAQSAGADTQLQVLRGGDFRRDCQPGYRGQADQYKLKRLMHNFLPRCYHHWSSNIGMRVLFLKARGRWIVP
uniref:Uncharacterized protein n=1 Tax=Rhizobium leguminosarum TaxID=384 RepID=A0A179BQA4_RHILE|nr:hypothetical protein A4U53_24920 [Rhizobium leguminosarum]